MFLALLMTLTVVSAQVSQRQSPIVGILTNPVAMNCPPSVKTPNRTQCFTDDYVSWLAQAAVRVVPIPFDANTTVLDALYASVNGILFTGGGLNLGPTVPYYQTAQYLYNKAVAGNAQGDYMPVWGTCQGFQLMNALAANNASVIHCTLKGVEGVYLPLNLTANAASSRMMGPAWNDRVITDMTSFASTGNFHNCGVFPSDYVDNSKLAATFNVLSTNDDTRGTTFLSTVEGISLPFYATQWHPEKTQYIQTPGICKSHECVVVSMWLANFLAAQLAKSTHSFPSQQAADAALIFNTISEYNGSGYFFYYF